MIKEMKITQQIMNHEAGHNQNWGEKCASTKLLHINEMVF